MLTTQSNVLYSITLYKGRICEVKIIPKKIYSYKILEDRELMIKISKHMAILIKGKVSPYDVGIYLEELSDLDKKVYKIITKIPIGQTITYKNLANKLNISVQKLSKILNRCPIPIFIPTHRVVKSNGQSGTHTISKEFKKELLKREKETVTNINMNKKKIKEVELITNEHLCYSLSDMLKTLI
jgi:O-6-methylguanine DNA methyltransferase